MPDPGIRIEGVRHARVSLRHVHPLLVDGDGEPRGGRGVLEVHRHGLTRAPSAGLQVVHLHRERAILEVARAACDDDALAYPSNNRVGPPHARGVGVVPREMERVEGEGELGRGQHVEQGGVR